MKCFHHNDLDGHGSGAVVAMFENDYDKENFFEVDYVQTLPVDKISKDEKVYFVDYSFSVNTVNSLKEILKKTSDIVWIDHHKSSVEMLKKYPEFKSIKGIIREGISGAALTYMYLYGKEYDDIPLILKYVSDFDCFHLKMASIMEFKYGIDSYNHNPLSDFWIRLFEQDSVSDNPMLDEIIDNGSIIKKYCENDYKRVRDSYSYEAEIDGHKAIVINRDGFSQLFGELYHTYDVCIRWNFDGENYIYSIYSDGKVDVSKIAEKFGGGGHPGAAGFSSKERLF